MIRFTNLINVKCMALSGGLIALVAACSTPRDDRASANSSARPVAYTHTAGGTPVYTAQANAGGGGDIDQRRIDETDTIGPGAPRGDRTSADPSETSSQGAGSRALVGQKSTPGFEATGGTEDTLGERETETAQGGSEIDDAAETRTSSGAGQEQVVIPLFKETANVGKRQVDAGTVTVRKQVRTETVNQPVELRTETVTIDRQPAAQGGSESVEGTQSFAGAAETGAQPFEQKEFTIRLTREEPVVEKRIVPAGQIVARTDVRTQQTNIQTQVRREDIQVDHSGTETSVNVAAGVLQGQEGQDQETAMGGGAATGEEFGAAARGQGGPVTELGLLSGPQAAGMAGRTVNIGDAKVRAVVGPQVVALEADGEPVYVRLPQARSDLKEGSHVKVTGTVRTPAQLSTANLTGEGAHILTAQPVVIEAESVQPAD